MTDQPKRLAFDAPRRVSEKLTNGNFVTRPWRPAELHLYRRDVLNWGLGADSVARGQDVLSTK